METREVYRNADEVVKDIHNQGKELITMHQPHFLPRLPYMAKIVASDIFVALSEFQFERGVWMEKQRVRNKKEEVMLSLDIKNKHSIEPIAEKNVIPSSLERVAKQIEINYSNAKHWYEAKPIFKQMLLELAKNENITLAEVNTAVMRMILYMLGWKGKFIDCPAVETGNKKVPQLVDIFNMLPSLGASDNFVFMNSPHGTKGYMILDKENYPKMPDMYLFDFNREEYPQKDYKKFMPYLSIVDLVCNVGWEEARKYLERNLKIAEFSKHGENVDLDSNEEKGE